MPEHAPRIEPLAVLRFIEFVQENDAHAEIEPTTTNVTTHPYEQ